MDLRTKRLLNEAKLCAKNEKDLAENGITIQFNEDKIDEAYVLITGQFDTPYIGYHTYLVNFPPEYPNKSMSVKAQSQDAKTRFHANQYANGKMCYDKMNGWGNNAFTSIDNIMSVFIQVRPSMGNDPLANEPGYHPKGDETTSYEVYVAHEVMRITVEGMLVDKEDKISFDFDGSNFPVNNYRRSQYDCFLLQIRQHFMDNYQNYVDFTHRYENDPKFKQYNGKIINPPGCYLNSSVITVSWPKRREALKKIYDYLSSKDFVSNPEKADVVDIKVPTAPTKEPKKAVKKTVVKPVVEEPSATSTEDYSSFDEEPEVEPVTKKPVIKPVVKKEAVGVPVKVTTTAVVLNVNKKVTNAVSTPPPTMKISKRKSPDEPAKTHEIGFTKVSPNDGKTYIVAERKDGVLFWKTHHS